MTKVYALREHDLRNNKTQDYITIRSEDNFICIHIPKETIERALQEFETGEEVNVNY